MNVSFTANQSKIKDLSHTKWLKNNHKRMGNKKPEYDVFSKKTYLKEVVEVVNGILGKGSKLIKNA